MHEMTCSFNKDDDVNEVANIICGSPEIVNATNRSLDIVNALHLADDVTQDEDTAEIITSVLSKYKTDTERWRFYLVEWKRQQNNVFNLSKLANSLRILEMPEAIDRLTDVLVGGDEAEIKNCHNHSTAFETERQSLVNSNIATTIVMDGVPYHQEHSSRKRHSKTNPKPECLVIPGFPDGIKISSTSNRGLLKNIWILSFLFIAVFGCTTTLQLKFLRAESDQLTDFFNDTKKALERVSRSVLKPDFSSGNTYRIIANSYNEFQKKMRSASEYTGLISVLIQLNNASDWSDGLPLQNANLITNLSFTGYIDISKIFSIVQEATYVKEVHLINSGYGFCQSNMSRQLIFEQNQQILLNSITTIHFENFSACAHIFSYLSKNVLLKNLASIHFTNSVINTNNLDFISRFLVNHKSSLQNLQFRATKWNATLFGNQMSSFPYVTNIRLDFVSDASQENTVIGFRFHDIFPALSSFNSNLGSLSLAQFSKLLECKNLVSITAKVTVPNNASYINMIFLREAYDKLKHVDISLYFPNKTWKDKCDVEGIETEKKHFNLTVRANCDVREI